MRVLLPGLVAASAERELKRRVDPLDRLVEPLHRDDAAIILPQNGVDTVAQAEQQHNPPAANRR